jgi:hypothetical protein
MLRITDDDLLLFKYLFEEQYIKRSHIRDFLWQHKTKGSIRVRLSRLLKNDYLKSRPDPMDVNGGTYLFATSKALNYYDLMFEDRVKKITRRKNTRLNIYEADEYKLNADFKINKIVQNNFLTELRFILEDWGVDCWESRSIFFPKYAKNPDSIFKIKAKINGEMKDLNIALEFERRKKYPSEYKEIFERYTKVEKVNFDYIIFVAYTDQVYNFFMENLNMSFYPVDDNSIKKYRVTKYSNLKNNNFITENPYINAKVDFKNTINKFVDYKRENGLI